MEDLLASLQSGLAGLAGRLWASGFSLAVLWLASLFCLRLLDRSPQFRQWQSGLQEGESLKTKKQLERERQLQNTTKAPAPRVEDAEEFVQLFEAWFCAEDVKSETYQSVVTYVKKLQDAGKELQRVHLVIESFQMRRRLWMESYNPQLKEEATRIQQLTDRFEYMKTYVEMRLCLLKTLLMLLATSEMQQKKVSVWVEETQALQETLHATRCDANAVIAQHLAHQKITEEACVMELTVHAWQKTVSEITALLKEIGTWTERFRENVRQKIPQNGRRPWTDLLLESLVAELERVRQQFVAVSRLTVCYAAHLEHLRLMDQWGQGQQGQQEQQDRRRAPDIPEMFHSMLQQVARKTARLKLKGL
ncbi:uncharacterized protein [Ambystoma mexicanum]|uniref:uncharacterized protein isoform X2 n=1 Tax=Ambystoma mexicanum TaxID=8296 RepID=UPI0037E9A915